jgi:peptidoglycan hydrolase CwlO-like protein
MCEGRRLIEEADRNPNPELAIVLAERLRAARAKNDEEIEALRDRAADFERDANRLDDEIYLLQQKIEELELMVSMRDDIIEELKKGN